MMTDEVIGKKIFRFSLSIKISPGSFPNQLSNQGVNFKSNPIIIRIIPIVISVLLIIYILLKKAQSYKL